MDKLYKTIRNYVSIHGLGEPTPELNSNLSVKDFLIHYYDKKTLIAFCRKMGLPSMGLKNELTKRIANFLETGTCSKIEKRILSKGPLDSELGLSLERQIVNYKSCAITRTFISKHVPLFKGFSAKIQKDTRERLARGEPLTYADLINEYQILLSLKPSRKVAHESCELNQFMMDFHDDNSWQKPHSIKEAWQLIRNSAGNRTYDRYKNTINSLILNLSKQG